MTYSYDWSEEELDRQRNNENGENYPTPRNDFDRGAPQQWYIVDDAYDVTDELDGHSYPLE